MNKLKVLIGTLLLLVACLAPAAFARAVTPSNSLINPANNTVYFAENDGTPRLRVFTPAGLGWTAGTSPALPGPSYGLALNSTNDKLYVSTANGAASLILVYTLNASGVPTGMPATLPGTWYSVSAPSGMAIGGQNRLFVTDLSVGMLRMYNLNDGTYTDITDHLAGQSTLYGVAVTPGTTSYKIYVSAMGTSGKIFVFDYNNGTVTYKKTITGLLSPTYLKVSGDKLFVAVNGPVQPDGADIMVYRTSDEQLVGTVTSGTASDYGWTSFYVSPDNSWLIFKKALAADESNNGLYKQSVNAINGLTRATLMKTTAFVSDGMILNDYRSRFGLSLSLTGQFDGTQTADVDINNQPPIASTLVLKQFNLDGTAIGNGETAKSNQVKVQASIQDPEGGNIRFRFGYRPSGTSAAFILLPTIEVASGAVAEAILPSSTTVLANDRYDWGVAYTDTLGAGTHGLVYGFDNDLNADFVINVLPAPTVISIDPNSGMQGATLSNVKITGTNFQSYPTVTFSGTGVTPGVVYHSPTLLTIGSLTIAPDAAPGVRTVTVTNKDGQKATTTFTVLNSSTAPMITGISPSVGMRGTTVNATIYGSNLSLQTAVKLTNGTNGLINATVNAATATTMSVSIPIKSTDTIGLWNVTVTSPDNQSSTMANSFSVVGDTANLPSVTNVYPRRGPTGTAHQVRIIGTNLLNATVKLQPANISLPLLLTGNMATQLTVTIPSTAPVGTYHLVVTNANGSSAQTAADTYEVTTAPEVPPVTSQIVNFNATDGGASQINLTWANPADNDMAQIDIRRYTGTYPTVYDANSGISVFNDIPAPGALNQSYPDSSSELIDGTTYYYVAFIQDTSGNWSTVDIPPTPQNADTGTRGFIVTDTTTPAAVSNLTANPGTAAGQVNLTWVAPGDDGMTGTVAGYQVRYVTSNTPLANPFTNANFAATGTAYNTSGWTNLAAGGLNEARTLIGLPNDPTKPTYIWVAIKAYDEVPNLGPLGATSSAETLVKDSIPAPTVTRVYPSRAPRTGTTLIAIEGTNFISGAVANIMTTPATPLTGVNIVSANRILATVPANVPTGTYHITVTTGGGTSAQTTADTFEVTSSGDAAASQIQNFKASSGEAGQSTLTWTNPGDNDMATIEVRRYFTAFPSAYNASVGTVVYAEGPVLPGAARQFVDTGLTNGTAYYYVAYIKDTSGNWSAVQPDKNAAVAIPSAGGSSGAISNLAIVRNGDTVGSSVTVKWQTNPTAHAAVKLYVKSGDFSTNAADWTEVASPAIVPQGDLDTYTDNNQVGSGTAKYYKLVSAPLQNSDLTTEVVGKFDLHVTEGSNLVSLPLVPANVDIGAVIGGQLTGGTPVTADKIYYYDSATASWTQAFLNGTGNWSGTLTSMEASKGYFINISTSNPTKDVTVVGNVFNSSSVTYSLYKDSNLISSPYAVSVPLNQANLASVLTGGTPLNADKVYYWDNATQGWLQAYLKTDNTFQGTLTSFDPGKGYYINNQALAADPQPDIWDLVRP